jgi:hypothetical protein
LISPRAPRLLGDEHGQTLVAGDLGVGAHQERHDVAARRVGDPGLVAGDPVDIAVAHRPSFERAQVRAGARFREDRRGQDLAGGDARQPFLLLLLGAAQADQLGGDLRAGGKRAQADVAPGQLLGHHAHGGLAQVQAAEGLGHGQAEDPQLGQLLDHLQGDQLVIQMPLVGGGPVIVGQLVELLAHHLERLVAQAGLAEVAGLPALGNQLGDARAHYLGVAARHQGLDRRFILQRLSHLGAHPQVPGPDDLHLAEGDAAGHLLQVLAEGGLEQQGFQLAQTALGVEPLGPAQHLAQGRHVGGEPGKAMGRHLLVLQQRRLHRPRGRHKAGHRIAHRTAKFLGGPERPGAGGQEIRDDRRVEGRLGFHGGHMGVLVRPRARSQVLAAAPSRGIKVMTTISGGTRKRTGMIAVPMPPVT